MHSPIVYILEIDDERLRDKGFILEDDLLPCEEELSDCLPESDWLKSNTLNDPTWHRGRWPLINLFENHSFMDVEVNEDIIKITIDKIHLKAWDEELNQALERYITKSREKILNNKLFQPLYDIDIDDYFVIEDKIGNAYGNTAFVLYNENSDGSIGGHDIFKEKDLIYYCKRQLDFKKKDKIEFYLCSNVVGDYHY